MVKEVGAELKIDPQKAKYMIKAYEIPQVRQYFMQKCPSKPSENGSLITFCKKCLEDKDIRKETYRWMSIVEDVGPGRLMFSCQ